MILVLCACHAKSIYQYNLFLDDFGSHRSMQRLLQMHRAVWTYVPGFGINYIKILFNSCHVWSDKWCESKRCSLKLWFCLKLSMHWHCFHYHITVQTLDWSCLIERICWFYLLIKTTESFGCFQTENFFGMSLWGLEKLGYIFPCIISHWPNKWFWGLSAVKSVTEM